MMDTKEFRVNKFITLKLEGKDTIIYVNGERFDQCKFLLLDVPLDEITSLDAIESIDEAAEKLDRSMEGNHHNMSRSITPEEEFWGHCSNLQVWYEENYNTNIIHSNLAFPLLKKLSEIGDPLAKRVFKEEIAKRLMNGNSTVIKFLLKEKYLNFLTIEEFESVILTTNIENLKILVPLLKKKGYYNQYFKILEFIAELTPQDYSILMELAEEYHKYSSLIFENSKLSYKERQIKRVEFAYKAINILKKALKLKLSDDLQAVIWAKIGVINRDIGDLPTAIDSFVKSILLNRSYTDAWDCLKWLIEMIIPDRICSKYIKETYIRDMPDWIKKKLRLLFL